MGRLRDPLQTKVKFGASTFLLFATLVSPIVSEALRRSDEDGYALFIMLFNVLPVYLAPTTLAVCGLYFLRYRRAQYAVEFLILAGCILWFVAGVSR